VVSSCATLLAQVSDNVTVGVEQTDIGDRCVSEVSLPARLTKQVLDEEHRRFVMIVSGHQRRQTCRPRTSARKADGEHLECRVARCESTSGSIEQRPPSVEAGKGSRRVEPCAPLGDAVVAGD
jgi:hypothetical protein